MNTINAIIVDDEEKSRDLLQKLLSRYCPEIHIAGTSDSVDVAVEMIRKNKPDLLFLDIEMSGETGFDLLEKISDTMCDVIFVTAYDKYAIRAIKFSASDYLLKPIDSEELAAAVKKVIEKKNTTYNADNIRLLIQSIKKKEEFTKISLPTGSAYEIVSINDIIRCESEGHYTNFMLADKRRLLVSVSLKYYEDLLPSETFIRVHHSHLININHVVRFLKVDGGYAVMSDNSQVEISRRKKDTFLSRLQNI